MPTSGTHITVVEQLALRDTNLKSLLGDPLADPDTAEGIQMRFAKLGAVGPDVLYMLGDFNNVPATALQDLENFLVKVGGSFSCLSDLSEQVNKWLAGELDSITAVVATEIKTTSSLISAVFLNGFLALLVDSGVNVWAAFRSPRQQDLPRTNWFWADYLHYNYAGQFAKHLLSNAKLSHDPNLYAYALGYLSHYVTDVVGHPYVNQIVQSPYRMHWQRHHLVENFIDAYVWDRWHVQRPEPVGAEERPLDAPTLTPNAMGTGAPLLNARLHDHITIGVPTLGDPVDAVIETVCEKIQRGLFDIGVLEKVVMAKPTDPGLKRCCELLVSTLRQVYADPRVHPTILAGPPDRRPGGYPTPDDISGAYGVLRLLLKISTENDIEPPTFPDIVGDITSIIGQTAQDIANDIGGIPPIPTPNTSGSSSLTSLIDAVAAAAKWVGEAVQHLGDALADAVAGIAGVGSAVVTDSIKIQLWLLDSALYALYRYFKDILVLNAYSLPFTDQLTGRMGTLDTSDLWISKGDLPVDNYPAEEDPRARKTTGNAYRPFVPPTNSKIVERPAIAFTAPYVSGGRPEAFLEAPVGPDAMFNDNALQTPARRSDPPNEQTFTAIHKNFGGAIANSAIAIFAFERIANDLVLPDFDLDGDRGYAWPGWRALDPLNPDPNDTGTYQRAIDVNTVNVTD